MRKILLAAILAAALGMSGTAAANGPSNSTETVNDVKCADGSSVSTYKLYYSGTGNRRGVELCSESGTFQGRVIVAVDGSYVAVDGDKDNNPAATGFVRAGSGGVCTPNNDTNGGDSTRC